MSGLDSDIYDRLLNKIESRISKKAKLEMIDIFKVELSEIECNIKNCEGYLDELLKIKLSNLQHQVDHLNDIE